MELTRASQDQNAAADPDGSTWLSANAGSGKTRVLTDRVARLLLKGANPQRILCLTFTKAAAGEMQNRLFQRLGSWAMLPDAELAEELIKLGESGPFDFKTARTLFAAAIETPGGLKIQTIHSFCASVLRRFPVEAGVSPQFVELDETTDARLRMSIVERLAEIVDPEAVEAIAQYFAGQDLTSIVADIVSNADDFGMLPDMATLLKGLGLPANITLESILADLNDPASAAALEELLRVLPNGKVNNAKAYDKISGCDPQNIQIKDLANLESAFLYSSASKDGSRPAFVAKTGAFPTKDTRAALGSLAKNLDTLMQRIEVARTHRLGLAAAEKAQALHKFAAAFLPRYNAEKAARGWLSFDDLIQKTDALLSHPETAEWVLYRLDGGIDHILIDEAQDTSPTQWSVIQSLSREISSGEGRSVEAGRSFFVVGDKKQSIYSFQGADAKAFDSMRDAFLDQITGPNPLATRELVYSFRSSPAILNAVDAAFEQTPSLAAEHKAYNEDLPGRVDIWPLVEPAERNEPIEWFNPVDQVAEDHHALRLAKGVAQAVAQILSDKTPLPLPGSEARPAHPGDILILVQSRLGNPSMFEGIIRALKEEGLPVAGADRLKLKESLAVKDITALLAFLALPEDSLSLAAALRSPLFGWSEQDLFTLAHRRTETFLWQALRSCSESFPDTLKILNDLRDASDYLTPYDLITRILVRHEGRAKLIARLGPDAEDPIDELLNLALAYEQNEAPSLTGFVSWLESGDAEIKRQLEGDSGRIRVMTVHGAKGLEAPIVILPDTTRGPPAARGEVLVSDSDPPIALWATKKADRPPAMQALIDARAESDAQERERLLYVAMTRAKSWLVLCGAGKAHDQSWYARVSKAAEGLDTQDIETPFGVGERYQFGTWPSTAPPEPESQRPRIALPDWCTDPPEAETLVHAALSPSDLGGAKALGGADQDLGEIAKQRGTLLHLLLEKLPAIPDTAQRTIVGLSLLKSLPVVLEKDTAHELVGRAIDLIDDPGLASIFGPDGLSEIPVSATLPELKHRRIEGTVDRLIVTPDCVRIIDFKSNQTVPQSQEQVPDGVLRQLGAYAAAISQIYPDREIQTEILWTESHRLMVIAHELVIAALLRTPLP